MRFSYSGYERVRYEDHPGLSGYRFHLFYVWLPSAEDCIRRVRERKSLGGHFVPEETIRRRYHGGIRNFFELYEPLASHWKFFDNTQKPRLLLASGGTEEVETVRHVEVWDKMNAEYHDVQRQRS